MEDAFGSRGLERGRVRVIGRLLEPMGGRGRTSVSAFGIFTLAAGVILHVMASRLRNDDAVSP